jgi:hypothetical protein
MRLYAITKVSNLGTRYPDVSTSHDREDGAMGVDDIYHSKSDVITTTTCVLNFFFARLVQQFISTNFNWCEGVSSVGGGSSRS